MCHSVRASDVASSDPRGEPCCVHTSTDGGAIMGVRPWTLSTRSGDDVLTIAYLVRCGAFGMTSAGMHGSGSMALGLLRLALREARDAWLNRLTRRVLIAAIMVGTVGALFFAAYASKPWGTVGFALMVTPMIASVTLAMASVGALVTTKNVSVQEPGPKSAFESRRDVVLAARLLAVVLVSVAVSILGLGWTLLLAHAAVSLAGADISTGVEPMVEVQSMVSHAVVGAWVGAVIGSLVRRPLALAMAVLLVVDLHISLADMLGVGWVIDWTQLNMLPSVGTATWDWANGSFALVLWCVLLPLAGLWRQRRREIG